MKRTKRLLIIGGGISGLSAAYYAQKLCDESGVDVEITLVEKSASLGGKIQTLRRDGFIIERGPDSFLARKLPIIDLIFELGLEHELVRTNAEANKTYILKNGRFHRIPPGLVLGIPTQIKPFVKSGLVSLRGKLRAALDLVLPRREIGGTRDHDRSDSSGLTTPSVPVITDESLGDFLKRRLGREVLEGIAEPLLAGIYAGDIKTLSLQATFPQFQLYEHQYGSLIKGMIKSRKVTVTRASNISSRPELPSSVSGSMFLSFRNGLESLVEALLTHLGKVDIKTGVSVDEMVMRNMRNEQVENKADKQMDKGNYMVTFSSGEQWQGDAFIVAIPTFQAAKLFENVDVQVEEALHHIPYVSVANIVFAYDRKDITHPLDGTGFLVPRGEQRFITACTWTSSKWEHVAPPDKILLRCYIGRASEEGWLELSQQEIVLKVQDELRALMNITAQPTFYEFTRWKKSMPQYPIGHLEQIKQMQDRLAKQQSGIYLAGSGYYGVGLPDCIASGKSAAKEAVKFLSDDDLKNR